MSLKHLTSASLKRLAILIRRKEAIQADLAAVLVKIDSIGEVGLSLRKPRKKRGRLSAAARANIAAGQKKRRAAEKAGPF